MGSDKNISSKSVILASLNPKTGYSDDDYILKSELEIWANEDKWQFDWEEIFVPEKVLEADPDLVVFLMHFSLEPILPMDYEGFISEDLESMKNVFWKIQRRALSGEVELIILCAPLMDDLTVDKLKHSFTEPNISVIEFEELRANLNNFN